jgi:hypothetical protein
MKDIIAIALHYNKNAMHIYSTAHTKLMDGISTDTFSLESSNCTSRFA